MAVIVAVLLYMLLGVDDVSAQTSCVISPNLTTLTIAQGLGRDVEIHCQCMDSNGMMIAGIRWFHNGTAVTTQNARASTVATPYQINTTPITLYINLHFNDNHDHTGTYTCSPNNMSSASPPGDTITLNAGSPSGAMRACTIYSLNTINATTMDIPSGTQNVILYCICRRYNNVAVGPTFWFINGTAVTRTTASGDNPYYRNNVPSPLIIPSFTATHAGTYGCGSLVRSNDGRTFVNPTSPTVTIDLTISATQPPTNVRATVLSSRSVEVTWTVSSSPNVTGYAILYTTTAEYIDISNRSRSVTVNDNSAISGTLMNLEEATTYTITVQVTSNSGNANSNPVSVTTYTDVPSSPPQNVVVTSSNSASLIVSWQPPSMIDHNGPITGHVINYTRVESSDMMSVNVNSGTTHNVSGLLAFVDYSVTVAARTVNGTGPFSNPPVVQTSGEDIPTPPRSLMIVDVAQTSVTLSWMSPDPPNGIITNYRVQYRRSDSSSSNYNPIDTNTNDLTYTVTELTTNTEYDFRVRADTVVGRSDPSNVVTALVGLPPPTNVRVTMLTSRSVEVMWTLSTSSEVTGYIISYTTTAEYIDISDRSGSVMLSGSATSHTLNNLEENTLYDIGIRATTDGSRRSGNIVVSVTTYTDVPSSPPQNVMVTSVNPASLMVSWQPPPMIDHNGPITYMIQYTGDGTSDMMNVNSGTTHNISGLVAYVDYSVIVAAVTVNGTGPFSDPPVVNRSGEDVPSEPQSLEAVSVNSSSMTLQWSPPVTPNGIITQYSLQYNTTAVANTTNNVLMYTISGLSSETVHVVRVRAHTSVGPGRTNNITVITRPNAVSDVTISNETISSSTLTLTWMEIVLTNSKFSHYTVFYLPVRGPYDRIMRRKRQSTQDGEFTIIFTGTTGTLTGLYGAVTYRIQVAIVGILNEQEITGDRSDAVQVTTLEGIPSAPRDLDSIDLTATGVTLTWRIPNPPNGLITQYNVSYIVTQSLDSSFIILPVDIGNDSVLSYTWTGLTQGEHQFIVVASTSVGAGEAASLTLTIPSATGGTGGSSGGSAGGIAGGVISVLVAVAVVVIVIIVVIYLRRRKGESSFSGKSTTVENSSVVPLKDITDGKSAGSYEPEIIGLPSELTAVEGQTFSFPSHVTGKPVPDVYWYLNSRDMTEDDVAVISSNGQLTLTLVSRDHEGEWRCQATNSSGSTEAKTRLTVTPGKAKPLPSPRPDRKHRPIPVHEFGTHVTLLHENSNQGFKVEYESFFNGEGMSTAVGSAPANKQKNRFANIVAYDENRVALGPCGSYKDDYVNASPLDGYKQPRCYIAAQAPVTKTLADFWRLVWQEHPPTIVMVTNLKEGEKVKCVQYWPNGVGQSQTFGPLNVTLTEEFEFADYVVRTMEIRNSELGNRLHVVTQYHFTAWPDHGVPDYATAILAFHRRLRSTHHASMGPLLVHCSAGVGRTGTFITIDIALEQIGAEGVVAIYNIVDKLRHQRPHMVQSQEQYMFIHDAILESITCGNTQVSAADLQRAVTKLKQRDPHTKLTGYEQQYKVLQQVSPRLEDQVCSSALKNPEKNRPNHCYPLEKGRVILRKEKSDYINASFLKGYKQDKAFIVAQSPMQHTIRDFWKMIHDRQCASVVMLCEVMEDGNEACAPYWPESGAFTYGDMTVTNINTTEAKEFTTRVFKVTDRGTNSTHQVTQFHYHTWGAHRTPASPAGLLVLIEEVQRVQRSTSNKPIVVHCSNILGRTGTFCAIFTILDRFKVEQVIDVLQTVKLLRIKRPGIVEDLDQYQFLFSVVVRFLQSFDTYDNFKI